MLVDADIQTSIQFWKSIADHSIDVIRHLIVCSSSRYDADMC